MDDLTKYDYSYKQAVYLEHERWVSIHRQESLERREENTMLDNFKKRLDNIIATPAEIEAAQQRYRDAHPEPEMIPIVSETDKLMQPYSKAYLAAMDRPAMDAEVEERVMANEVMGDIAPSLAAAYAEAFETCGSYQKSIPQTEWGRYALSQKRLPVMEAPHGWDDRMPDAETRRIRDVYEKDRRR
jgi:hypothetical protein